MTLFTKTQHEQLIANCQAQIVRMDAGDPDARFRVMDPPGFGVMDPPCMGYRRSRGLRVLRVLFLRGKFSGFDAPIGVAGDVNGERGVLESIPDGVEDDGVRDDLVPVVHG